MLKTPGNLICQVWSGFANEIQVAFQYSPRDQKVRATFRRDPDHPASILGIAIWGKAERDILGKPRDL